MELENTFVVPAGLDAAWARLLDVEAVAPCMPGATLTSRDGDDFAGSVKVKLGPVSMVYNGTARFVEQDVANHKAVIEAAGKDTKGTSTARATVSAALTAETAETTRVDVATDLAITGRPAQFGRGVMQDVAGRIIDQFAANLAHVMGAEGAGGPAEPGREDAAEPTLAVAAAKKAPAKKAATKRPPSKKPAAKKAPAQKSAAQPTTELDAPSAEAAPDAPPVQPDETIDASGPQAPSAAAAPVPKHQLPHPHEAIDLIEHAGAPVLRRAAPVLAGLVVLWVLWRVLRRRG